MKDNRKKKSERKAPLMEDSIQVKLLSWYKENARPLPWRKNREPYRIWISEVMLQQTTVTAVIPYYKNFMSRFPTLKALAQAELSEVYEYWAGLGYYSRARNLKKAAEEVNKKKSFPKTHTELLELPGFGPYTARAVSSLAFSEPVGVLDGNVIRVLSRLYNLRSKWWKSTERNKLQALADDLVQNHPSETVNQALMELGATICTPKSPKCILCPWLNECAAKKAGLESTLPLQKPKRALEVWIWKPQVQTHNNKFYFEKNYYAPFLKNALIPPGRVEKAEAKPKDFDFCHSITHHKIYVQIHVQNSKKGFSIDNSHQDSRRNNADGCWLSAEEISGANPASLIKKTIGYVEKNKKNTQRTQQL